MEQIDNRPCVPIRECHEIELRNGIRVPFRELLFNDRERYPWSCEAIGKSWFRDGQWCLSAETTPFDVIACHDAPAIDWQAESVELRKGWYGMRRDGEWMSEPCNKREGNWWVGKLQYWETGSRYGYSLRHASDIIRISPYPNDIKPEQPFTKKLVQLTMEYIRRCQT